MAEANLLILSGKRVAAVTGNGAVVVDFVVVVNFLRSDNTTDANSNNGRGGDDHPRVDSDVRGRRVNRGVDGGEGRAHDGGAVTEAGARARRGDRGGGVGHHARH